MRDNLLLSLDKYLKGKRVVLIGIGNRLKGDDQLGPLLISRLQGKTNLCLFDCAEVPENYIHPIIESKPETIIIVDASDWGGKIGDIRMIEKEEIKNFGFSTHNASISFFFDYLKRELPLVNIIIIGVQIGNKGFMRPLSKRLESTLNKLADFFIKY